MAKVQFSALVNSMHGALNGSIFRQWKGVNVLGGKNNSPRQARSAKQQNIRGMLSMLAGEYFSLSATQKELWTSFAAMSNTPLSPSNAYISFNQRLQKYFPGCARKMSPPATPDTPEFPLGFAVSPQTGSSFCVQWTSPVLSTLTVIVDQWAMPGRDSTSHPRWTFGVTAGADTSETAVASAYPPGTILKFRIRTIDQDGRVSPWSHILQAAAIV